jgi:hypothetical protein
LCLNERSIYCESERHFIIRDPRSFFRNRPEGGDLPAPRDIAQSVDLSFIINAQIVSRQHWRHLSSSWRASAIYPSFDYPIAAHVVPDGYRTILCNLSAASKHRTHPLTDNNEGTTREASIAYRRVLQSSCSNCEVERNAVQLSSSTKNRFRR